MADETILVVDDSATILKVVQLVLSKAGYRVLAASGGAAGIVAAQEQRPDLVLLDYLMPDVDGEAVCRAMSGSRALAKVPVVIMSARQDEVGERFSDIANVVDHITKPFSPEALLAVITHSLGTRSERPSLRSLIAPPAARPEKADTTTDGAGAPTPEPAAGDAALSGDLALVGIADVLTLLQDQQQSGVIRLAKVDLALRVTLRGGRIDFATAKGIPDEFLLGRFVVEVGAITAKQLAAVVEERKQDTQDKGARGGLFGADLVARGLVSPADLQRAMALQTSSLVYESLRWGSGRFSFFANEPPDRQAREARLDLPIDALIMEGLRRVDEWRLIEREIGDFEQIFVRSEEKLSSFARARLLREELAVLEYVNGRNTVKDIVAASKKGSFEVTQMLFRLLRNKLIRRRVAPLAV